MSAQNGSLPYLIEQVHKQATEQMDLQVALNFTTNKGNRTYGYYSLDTSEDDKEKGQWNYYLFRSHIPYQAVLG